MCNACGIKWKRRVKGTSLGSTLKKRKNKEIVSSPAKSSVQKGNSQKSSKSSKNSYSSRNHFSSSDEEYFFGQTDDENSVQNNSTPESSPGRSIQADSPPIPSVEAKELQSSSNKNPSFEDYNLEVGRSRLRDRNSFGENAFSNSNASSPTRIEGTNNTNDSHSPHPIPLSLRYKYKKKYREREHQLQPRSLSIEPSNVNDPMEETVEKTRSYKKTKRHSTKESSPKSNGLNKSVNNNHLSTKDKTIFIPSNSKINPDGFSVSFRFPDSELRKKRVFFQYASFELERLEEEMKFDHEVNQFKEQVQNLRDQLHQRDILLATLLQSLESNRKENAVLQELPNEVIQNNSFANIHNPIYETL